MFCPTNTSIELWDNAGFGICFYDVLRTSVPFAFMILFGFIQIWFYGKYAHNIEQEYIHRSYLFMLQIALAFAFIMESLVRFAFETDPQLRIHVCHVDNLNHSAANRKAKGAAIGTEPRTRPHSYHLLVNDSRVRKFGIYLMAKPQLVLEIGKQN